MAVVAVGRACPAPANDDTTGDPGAGVLCRGRSGRTAARRGDEGLEDETGGAGEGEAAAFEVAGYRDGAGEVAEALDAG